MIRRTLIIAAAVASLWATTANAASVDPVPADSIPQLGSYLPTARAAWPASPCAGREIVGFSDTIGSANGLDADGGAVPELCYVVLNPKLLDPADAYNLCAVLTHELGHLAGQEHTADPTSIMAPRVPSAYKPCLDVLGITIAAPPVVPAPVVVAPPVQQPASTPKTPVKKCRQKTRKARRACIRKRAQRP